MTNEKNPTAPPDFETARRMLAEPGFFEDGIAQIEALRGQLPDSLVDDLLDGARRLYERSKIPVEQITDDDPVLERAEVIFMTAAVMEMVKQQAGRDFFIFGDLKNSPMYERALEIESRFLRPELRRTSEIVALIFEFFLIVRHTRTGVDAEVYLDSLEPVLDGLRGLYSEDQLDAFRAKVRSRLVAGAAEH